MESEHTVSSVSTDRTVVQQATPTYVAHPADAPVVVATAPVEREIHDVRTRRTVSWPAIFAGVLAAFMMIVGGALMARAGVDDSLGEPVVSVAGVQGTALGGIILLALGLGLLFAAFSAERGAILFLSLLVAIAATIVAMVPEIADGKLGFTRGFSILMILASVAVALAAVFTPTMRYSRHHVERV